MTFVLFRKSICSFRDFEVNLGVCDIVDFKKATVSGWRITRYPELQGAICIFCLDI